MGRSKGREMEQKAAQWAARLMVVSARTALKARGVDHIITCNREDGK